MWIEEIAIAISKKSKIIYCKSFVLQETVILLDVGLTFNKKDTSTNASSKIASQRLRVLAVSRKMEIDDAFQSTLDTKPTVHYRVCL